MKFINYSLKTILPMLIIFFGVSANAQTARLSFEKLNGLEDKATEVIEVSIDGKLLSMAKRVLMKVKEKDAKTIGEAIKGLEAIYVRVYKFDKEDQYNLTDIEEIRSQLKSPGWEKVANVRSKKENQKVDVYAMFQGETMSGLAVVVSETKSIAVVNVIGPIDIDLLAELGGNMGIPKIEIAGDNQEKPKN